MLFIFFNLFDILQTRTFRDFFVLISMIIVAECEDNEDNKEQNQLKPEQADTNSS